MFDIRRAATEELTHAELTSLRALLDVAFAGRFDDYDWQHALGGVHLLGYDDGELVGHGSVVPRVLWCGEQARRTGYVEAVGVHPDRQGRGHGWAMMTEAADVIADGYELGALCASERAARLYRKLGWLNWLGPTYVATAAGRLATPEEDGAVFVLPEGDLDLTQPIVCDWRSGDVW